MRSIKDREEKSRKAQKIFCECININHIDSITSIGAMLDVCIEMMKELHVSQEEAKQIFNLVIAEHFKV